MSQKVIMMFEAIAILKAEPLNSIEEATLRNNLIDELCNEIRKNVKYIDRWQIMESVDYGSYKHFKDDRELINDYL